MALTLNPGTGIGSISGTSAGATVDATGALQLPTGTTAQRPSLAAGIIRYNTTNNQVEVTDGTYWYSVNVTLVA